MANFALTDTLRYMYSRTQEQFLFLDDDDDDNV